VPLRTGDVVFCPAGVPHAIGSGVLVIEVQEPTDFSIMLEYAGHGLDPEQSFLGLEQDLALQAVRRTAMSADDLEAVRGRTIKSLATGQPGVTELLPEGAAGLFRAEQVVARDQDVDVDRGFSVLVVNEGRGVLTADNADPVEVSAGQTLVLPHALEGIRLRGQLSTVRCAPAA
jgi:mannose-6-phosphate isomerase